MDEFLCLWAQWGILDFERYQKVRQAFGDWKTAWEKIDLLFLAQLGFGREKAARVFALRRVFDFQALAACLSRLEIQILCIEDDLYPAPLKTIPNPPPFLFVRGSLPSFHKALSVVGTRQVTDYGRRVAEKLAGDLAQNGFAIVSGLALGVDALAHEATLKNNGITVAVLGCGADCLYPVENQTLGERILNAGGAIVSEYPLGTPALRHHFPARNRLVSGLSRGVLIVEGSVRSGALITARYALEQGREVFAVPHDVTRAGMSGTHHLIRRGEAKLVERVEDILEEFGLQNNPQAPVAVFSAAESALLGRLQGAGKSLDDLALETAYNVAQLSEFLIGLQLKGAAREIGGRWVLL